MKRLEFNYTLKEHGWAHASFEMDGVRHQFEHGYCEDPLRSLAKLAAALAKGTGIPRSNVIFDLEQDGCFQASFLHRDPTEFALTRHREIRTPGSTLSGGDLLMHDAINSVAFAVCVGRELHQIIRSHGLTGYLRTWSNCSFPLQEYLFLRMYLDESPMLDELNSATHSDSLDLEIRVLQTEPVWSFERLPGRFPNIDPWD